MQWQCAHQQVHECKPCADWLPPSPRSALVFPSLPAAVYFAVIKTWEGHPELIMATLTSKFGPTLAANYVIWPIAHLINFRFVPSE